jgi:hypothetical protein
VFDPVSLVALETRAADLELNQRLPQAWLDRHLAPGRQPLPSPRAVAQLQPPSDVPLQLRGELLIELADGEQVLSLLDVLPEDYDRLPSVRARAEYLAVAAKMSEARSVKEWSETCEGT